MTTLAQPVVRVQYLDILRVLACFMVIMVHAGEFFYIGPGDSVIREHGFWVNVYGSLLRSCVPLFVVISGHLLIPSGDIAPVFYKKRFARIIYPFVAWSVAYTLAPFLHGQHTGREFVTNLITIPINWSQAGHLWYVYMIIGVYLFIPILSPWYSTSGKQSRIVFLGIWAATLFIHFLRRVYPQVFGESHWNEFHSFYYFSGYIGYLVMGAYLRDHWEWNKRTARLAGLALFVTGYIITYYGFDANITTAPDIPTLEVTWRFTTINVAMMTLGIYLIAKDIQITNKAIMYVVQRISSLSYGIYLAHIFILTLIYNWLKPFLVTPALTIPIVAVITFIVTSLLIQLLSYLPKSKYIIG